MRVLTQLVILPLLVSGLALPAPAISSPLPVRDQNPLLAGFDLPGALPAKPPGNDAWLIDANLQWSSSALMQANPREILVVDAETRELRLAIGYGFTNGYALRLEIPYRHTSAGTLDGFIDEWHDLFGLPDGARATMPRNALQIFYERDGAPLIEERASQAGIGDLSLRLGRQLGASPFAAWLSVKLPTGDADSFAGSGSIDASAALAFERSFGTRYTAFAQAAGTWLGDGDRLRRQQKNIAWSGMAGINARLFQNVTLAAQIDAHTAIYDSKEAFLGDAVMLTLGGTYRLTENWELSFGVTEDIAVESTSDVAFLFQVKARR